MRTKGREAAMEQGRCKIKPKVIYSILRFISLLISNRMSWRLSADVCLFIFLPNPLKKKKSIASVEHQNDCFIVDRIYSPELKTQLLLYALSSLFFFWHLAHFIPFCYFELFFHHYLQEAALACSR